MNGDHRSQGGRGLDTRWSDRFGGHLQLRDRAGQDPAARYNRAARRMRLVVGVLALYMVVAVAASMSHVANVEDVRRFAEGNTSWHGKVQTRRGDIVDRNGVTLATDVRSDALAADPYWYKRPGAPSLSEVEIDTWRQEAARTIAKITDYKEKDLLAKLQVQRGFVYLCKNLDIEQSRALRAAIERGELRGITIEPDFQRYHPAGDLAGAALGRAGWQGNVEVSFDGLLSGQTVEVHAFKNRDRDRLYLEGAPDPSNFGGRSIELTLDKRIQAVLEQQLVATVKDTNAEHAVGVVIDVKSGEILAMAQSPSLNPDGRGDTAKSGWRNRVIQDQFEPGSTMKVLTYAIALEEGKITPNDRFATAGGLHVPGKLITDSHPKGDIAAWEAVKYSSNVAMAKIAFRVGRVRFEHYLKAFGIGRSTDVGLADEIGGSLPAASTWKPVRMANIAFGQGVAVTALQITNAFAAIARNGVMKRPRLVRAIIDPDGTRRSFPAEPGTRVVSEKTAKLVLEAMATVCEPGGTARRGRLEDYRCAGKTGTAQQYDPNGGYSKTHWIASFIGLYPMENPRLAVFVAVDTPRKRHARLPDLIIRTGGEIAAPVVREVARFALAYLGVPKSPGAPWLAADDPVAARERAVRRGPVVAANATATAGAAAAKLPTAAPSAPALVGVVLEAPDRDATVEASTAAVAVGRVAVPDLRGLAMRAAIERLEADGLDPEIHGSGVAILQQPTAGTLVRVGDRVSVTFRHLTEQAALGPAP